MQSFYRWHWIPAHAGRGVDGMYKSEKDLFAETPNDIIKIVTVGESVPYLDYMPAGCKIIVRYQPLTENAIGPAQDQGRVIHDEAHAKRMAATHAASMLRIAQWAEANGCSRERLWFSGLNEQKFSEGGGHEPYALGVVYWLELLRLNHANHLHTVIGEFGIGWPPQKQDGVAGSPADFDTFRPAWEAMDSEDAWSYHAYWGSLGVDYQWTWLAARVLQRPDWMHGKRLWITECGSDSVAASTTKGWLQYPGGTDSAAVRYVKELAQFEKMIREQDPDVEYAFIFTVDGVRDDWGTFELELPSFMHQFIPYVTSDLALSLAKQPATQDPPIVVPTNVPVTNPTQEKHMIDVSSLKDRLAQLAKDLADANTALDTLAGTACPACPECPPSQAAEDTRSAHPHLLRPLPAQYEVTQIFGANPDNYAKFGLAGHEGYDYGCPEGTEVHAAHGGRIEVGAFDAAGYGNFVMIHNGDYGGYFTLYGHLSKITVENGQMVAPDDAIGLSGNTGNSTGPHMHFGMKFYQGRNPAYKDWIDANPFRLIP